MVALPLNIRVHTYTHKNTETQLLVLLNFLIVSLDRQSILKVFVLFIFYYFCHGRSQAWVDLEGGEMNVTRWYVICFCFLQPRCPFNQIMGKENVVHLHNAILFRHYKQEQRHDNLGK